MCVYVYICRGRKKTPASLDFLGVEVIGSRGPGAQQCGERTNEFIKVGFPVNFASQAAMSDEYYPAFKGPPRCFAGVRVYIIRVEAGEALGSCRVVGIE